MRLKNKVAIISGVGRRFGQAAALLFAKEGAKVVLSSRTEELIDLTIQIINERNGTAIKKVADATEISEVNSVVELAISEFGRIDIMLNNVGGFYSKRALITDLESDEWENTLSNNLRSIFNFTKAVIPVMREKGGGSIINVSAAPKTLLESNSAYSAAKGGVRSLTRNLAYDFRADGISVNSVSPGVIRNDTILEKNTETESRLKRTGKAEDVANAILYLASDESSWVTGQDIIIDGGESLHIDI